jgi:hypothetical protein
MLVPVLIGDHRASQLLVGEVMIAIGLGVASQAILITAVIVSPTLRCENIAMRDGPVRSIV